MIAIYMARDVEPPTLMLLLIMDDALEEGQAVMASALTQPVSGGRLGAAFIEDFDRLLVKSDDVLRHIT